MRKSYVLALLFASFMLISPVYAQEDVNLADFPQYLADRLTIDLFPAQLLTSAIFLGLFLFPALLLAGKDNSTLAILGVSFPVLGFCVAMGWLPVWIMILFTLVTAVLFSDKIRGLFAR